MGAPGFWDDQEKAARISAEHARATKKLETYETLAPSKLPANKNPSCGWSFLVISSVLVIG